MNLVGMGAGYARAGRPGREIAAGTAQSERASNDSQLGVPHLECMNDIAAYRGADATSTSPESVHAV